MFLFLGAPSAEDLARCAWPPSISPVNCSRSGAKTSFFSHLQRFCELVPVCRTTDILLLLAPCIDPLSAEGGLMFNLETSGDSVQLVRLDAAFRDASSLSCLAQLSL